MRLGFVLFLCFGIGSCGIGPVSPHIYHPGTIPDIGNHDSHPGDNSNPGPDQGDNNLPPPSKILYVNRSNADEGNGTVAAPFKSLSAAVTVATKGTEIKIAAGEYDENI